MSHTYGGLRTVRGTGQLPRRAPRWSGLRPLRGPKRAGGPPAQRGDAARHGDAARERRTLSAIQESLSEGLVVLDSGGRVTHFNRAAAALWGLAAADVQGKPAQEMLRLKAQDFQSPKDMEGLSRIIGGPADTSDSVVVALLRPQSRELSVTAFPILVGPRERMTGLLVRDATRERELERRRDRFVSVASHELRTPMTTIMGFSELLLQTDPPPATRRQWLERIYQDSQRLSAIVDDLLNVSRIQSGELAVNLERLPLPPVAAEVLRSIRPTTDKHEFQVHVPPDLPPVVADRGKLGQVFTNLLNNAVKYSPQGGRITVAARYELERERVVASVADQGIGIAPEDQEHLFTTFHRIHRPETEGIRGTGLGLYIVKGLVRLMHGEVWVESELNRGSTFFFTLPIRPAYEQEGGTRP